MANGVGDILILNFKIKDDAKGPISIDLVEADSSIQEGEVQFSAIDGNISLMSDGAGNSSPTGSVSIAGTATQGATLTADTTNISDADGLGSGGFSYQWKADGTDITGATAKTFVPTQDQVGKAISVVVSYVDGGSTAETLTSAATAIVVKRH